MVDDSTIVVPIIIEMLDWKFIVEVAMSDLLYESHMEKNCDRLHYKTK